MSNHTSILPDWYKEAMAGARRLEEAGNLIGAEQVRSGANSALMLLDKLEITIGGKPFMGEQGSTQLEKMRKR